MKEKVKIPSPFWVPTPLLLHHGDCIGIWYLPATAWRRYGDLTALFVMLQRRWDSPFPLYSSRHPLPPHSHTPERTPLYSSMFPLPLQLHPGRDEIPMHNSMYLPTCPTQPYTHYMLYMCAAVLRKDPGVWGSYPAPFPPLPPACSTPPQLWDRQTQAFWSPPYPPCLAVVLCYGGGVFLYSPKHTPDPKSCCLGGRV